jgi:protein involved in polysaccharide export with SLBB domain
VARIHPVFLVLSLVLLSAVVSESLVAQDAAPSTPAAPLMLRPGDVIRLKIWREPDFSGDYPIDENGMATFPRLGPVRAASFTTDSLKRTLVASYATYLVNPSIEVTTLRRLNVLGAVRNPGLYQVDPTVTVADAIALAGGITDNGQSDRVELVRDGKRLPANVNGTTRLADTPLRSGDQLFVPQRSWLSRNVGVVAAGISALGLVTAAAIKN